MGARLADVQLRLLAVLDFGEVNLRLVLFAALAEVAHLVVLLGACRGGARRSGRGDRPYTDYRALRRLFQGSSAIHA